MNTDELRKVDWCVEKISCHHLVGPVVIFRVNLQWPVANVSMWMSFQQCPTIPEYDIGFQMNYQVSGFEGKGFREMSSSTPLVI